MVFWHPNGWSVYQVLEQYMRKVQRDHGYVEVRTPRWSTASSGSVRATG